MTTEIFRVSVQLRRPMGQDAGDVAQACYFLDGDLVVLCHRDGKAWKRDTSIRAWRRDEPAPLTRWERKLKPGEDHLRAAKELLMQQHSAGKKGSDFHRPINYRPTGIV